MCRGPARGGTWHTEGAERRPKGLELLEEGRGQIKRRQEAVGLVKTSIPNALE